MKDFTILKILDRLSPLFIKLGVDYPIMRKILQVKLILDGRRSSAIMSGASKKDSNNNFTYSLFMYALLGVFMIPVILIHGSYMFQMSLVFGMYMFIIMTSLMSDFSSVLLDINDRNIIFSKSVDLKTIGAAKAIHVFIYLISLTIAFAGIPLIVSLFSQGVIFFAVFAAEIFLTNLFIIAITALLYLVVLKYFDGEKLKDIINYVQIVLTIAISIGYQFVGQFFSVSLNAVSFTPKWWQYFIIPIWFGAPFELIIKGSTDKIILIFSVLAVLIPILSILIYVKHMPSFEVNLQKLSNIGHAKKSNGRLAEKLGRFFCRTKEERLFFRFTINILNRERELKLRIYPMLGLSIALPLILLSKELFVAGLGSEANNRICLYIYSVSVSIPATILISRYSTSYKAAWIYRAVPLKEAAPILAGTFKAMLVRILIPILCADAIIFTCILGFDVIVNLIACILNILLFAVICFKIIKPVIPFSREYIVTQSKGWIVLLTWPVILALGVIHFFCTYIHYGVYSDIVIVGIANIIFWRQAFKVSWARLIDD